MNKRSVCVALISASVAALLSPGVAAQTTSAAPARASNPPLNVNVTNVPLPVTGNVTGTVSVSGTVPVSGTVGLTTGSTVTIANTATNPVLVSNVDNPAQQGFQASGVCIFPTGQSRCFIDLTVPNNNLLVIETVSVNVFTQPGGRGKAVMETVHNGVSAGYVLPVQPQGVFGIVDEFVGLHAVRLHADPGTIVRFFLDRASSTSTVVDAGNATISGYLVKIP